MAEYIEREAAHRMVAGLVRYSWTSPISTERRSTLDADDVNFGLDKIPAADVAPVVRGRWEPSDTPCERFRCSECGGGCWYYDYQRDVAKSRFCPNCGAKMDLD